MSKKYIKLIKKIEEMLIIYLKNWEKSKKNFKKEKMPTICKKGKILKNVEKGKNAKKIIKR